ncbi:MAG: cell division ATP-binding protein FtsE [Nitrospira sp. ST-bin4]|jgi:cell division transport system ATP-binding protein|uniref:cell division ATP-binding protein FtsE n=1 Tax=Nitrospira cf. moscoviensis SBR1015 TaxID=96242 RepID=UPI000A0AA931|nr:cell division ATP-binding protein FtsE [Nitrospira cf. moscoviensis SBR1015]MBH0204247.1 cell division ATP-binding protein FtsE [Nitrospira sp.]MBY0249636.1 cell division ATP-binding protein FtsE [Nitrospiraceae bacterium]OQW30773.1 MAG: cell division ATP-binding protein FtsE [Nitrospira sp. SG-bin2]OQW59121.1 MAG: cell division ATP-binding protein FtsE [Nitrospira sp. ST-bin4]
MIQLIHVSKSYDRRVALFDVTMEIEKGEFVLLMGPSGAGKSTLLRMLIGEERPDEGQIFVQGKNVSRLKQSEVPYLRRKIGTVFQDFRLLGKKSVFENVALPLIVQRSSEADIRRKVMDALRAVGVDHKKDQSPNSLSTGEQQRVCIARAIVNGPVVLLADEPTGNLDPERTAELIELFKLINARGTTVVVATHDPHVMKLVNRRVMTLMQGVLIPEQRGGDRVDA